MIDHNASNLYYNSGNMESRIAERMHEHRVRARLAEIERIRMEERIREEVRQEMKRGS